MRCSVCSTPGSAGISSLRQQFPDLEDTVPACGTGAGEEEQPLALMCPRNVEAGCLTQTTLSGGQVSKMCSNIPVDDCKSANGVEYCYCRGEMCNVKSKPLPPAVPLPTVPNKPPPTHPTHPHSFQLQQVKPGDDEDDNIEGSGGGSRSRDKTTAVPKSAGVSSTTQRSTTQRTPSAATSQHISLALVLLTPLLAQF
ncbi:hypothetical protein B566_EDAN004632 [Ephemera danica]|nr:hypothetical protein B566_EDAN004632 [Ephemera danica]